MKCPECVKENKESCLYPSISYVTDAYYPPFYDKEGKYHHHDGNVTTNKYYCSNGHQFNNKSYGSCWCGWGKENDNN